MSGLNLVDLGLSCDVTVPASDAPTATDGDSRRGRAEANRLRDKPDLRVLLMAVRAYYPGGDAPAHVMLTGIFGTTAGRHEADLFLRCDLDWSEFSRYEKAAERHFQHRRRARTALAVYDAIAEDANGSVTCPQHERKWSYGIPGFTCRSNDCYSDEYGPASWPCHRVMGIAEFYEVDLSPVDHLYTALRGVDL